MPIFISTILCIPPSPPPLLQDLKVPKHQNFVSQFFYMVKTCLDDHARDWRKL
jgi:hypothetical protein